MSTVREDGSSTIQFGIFEVDLRAAELRRNGSRIKLQDQPFQILTMLLAQPGQVVTREELQKKLWPSDIFVDFDHSLNAAIRRLRDALGDSAENPRFVETVARRGYRFIAPVNGATLEVAPQPNPPRAVTPKHFRQLIIGGLLTGVVLVGWIVAHWPKPPIQISSVQIKQRRLTANSEENPVFGAVISPDGKYLAFADTTGVYLRQIDSGETHSLNTQSGFRAVPAAWYPDGSHLVATWVKGPTAPSSLWQVSILGGEPRELIDEGRLPAVSPKGGQIAFVRGPKHAEEIWTMDANGENPKVVAHCKMCTFGTPAWSPDGEIIAYVMSSYRGNWMLHTSVVLLDLSSGHQETLLSPDSQRAAPGAQMEIRPPLVWTSDNRLIYSISELPPNENESNVWSVPLDFRRHIAGPALRLTAAPDEVEALSISTDSKRIAYTKSYLDPAIYISELSATGTRLSMTHRLTLDTWRDYPFAWTSDSKAVIFSSDRDGPFHIFKQRIADNVPELLVGDEEVSLPRLAPDNSTILFEVWPKLGQPEAPRRIMRVPDSGGPPQIVLQQTGMGNMQCARPPSDLCLYDVRTPTQVSFFRFDPLNGKSQELPSIAIPDQNSLAYNWTLSPDGKILAAAKGKVVQEEPNVTFIALADGSKHNVTAQGWAGINSIDFAADNRSIWASAYTNTGKWALLNIDLQGHTRTVLEDAQMTIGWAIPSPDGKRLAFWKARGTSNVWMLEGF
jgi:DNA-binding winged helix-turn-helix (wHTH) protein/Tol biopolymer transport system component